MVVVVGGERNEQRVAAAGHQQYVDAAGEEGQDPRQRVLEADGVVAAGDHEPSRSVHDQHGQPIARAEN
jgi:hypothetical protein